MAFEALRARILAQQAEMHDHRYLEDLVADAQSVIKGHAPDLSGRMVRNLTTPSGVVDTADGLHAGLGDRSLVGREDSPAPSGVIKAFLEDHPEYRLGREKSAQEPVGERVKQEFTFEKRKAWSYLSDEAKSVLQQARQGGDYGGGPESPYFFQQEGSLDGWSKGAYPANITPSHFMPPAMDEWRAESLPLVLGDLRRHLGLSE